MFVTEWVSMWLTVSTDFTDVTMVCEDIYSDEDEDEEQDGAAQPPILLMIMICY